MATITTEQDREVTFISGVGSDGTADDLSFATWNYDSPPTYDASEGLNYTAKFGSPTSGTGATISYQFDPASNWTETEQDAFSATAKLWSAVANVTFVEQASGAQVTITRGSEGSAYAGGSDFTTATTGTNQLGVRHDGQLVIDTSVAGFGPIGGALGLYGGYPYTTMVHEWGHILGLGHGGPYDSVEGLSPSPYTSFDTIAYTLMSYNDPQGDFDFGASTGSDGFLYPGSPTTWMPLDILAIQRLYGTPVNTPLSGGQTYGFHSNIGGEIAKFFDFTINTKPVVTIWNAGTGNTLDLSGFTFPSVVDLHDGSYSSVATLHNNLAIAYGTRIDTLVTGFGADRITGNDNGNVIYAGGGADSILGGSGNDHLYGAAATAISNDGADTITGGGGNDYIQGNAGDDRLAGGTGADRIQGGQGNDSITGDADNDSVNGNLGNDTIDGGGGNDSLRGGQGADSIQGGIGNDVLLGDLGADSLAGGGGIDVLTGGGDADVFVFAAGDAAFATSGALAGLVDMVTDFVDGVDHLDLPIGIPTSIVQGGSAADFASAASAAQHILDSQGLSAIAVFRIGEDSYLFYDQGPTSPIEAIKLAGLADPTLIGTADFV